MTKEESNQRRENGSEDKKGKQEKGHGKEK